MGALEAHAERFESPDVHVDGAGTEVVATGQGHARLTGPGQQGAQHRDRGAHLLDELVGRLRHQVGTHVDLEHMLFGPADVDAD